MMTWLLFVELMLALTPGGSNAPTYFHVALGVAIIALAFINARAVRQTTVPGRVKRTVRSTCGRRRSSPTTQPQASSLLWLRRGRASLERRDVPDVEAWHRERDPPVGFMIACGHVPHEVGGGDAQRLPTQ